MVAVDQHDENDVNVTVGGDVVVVEEVAMCARVCVCVCVFVFVFVMRMYHGCFSMSIFEMESKERSNCHVELWQCELQMQVRQL